MRYYLDFDRTLFDTNAFYSYMQQRPGTDHLAGFAEPEITAALGLLAIEGKLSFEPGELSPFLFPDAAQFLREKENAATVITAGNKEFQELKIRSALYGIPRTSVMYTGSARKGEYLAPHAHLHADAVLVDDTPAELEVVAARCPEIQLFEMRRDSGVGDGRWPVVRMLSELPNTLSTDSTSIE